MWYTHWWLHMWHRVISSLVAAHVTQGNKLIGYGVDMCQDITYVSTWLTTWPTLARTASRYSAENDCGICDCAYQISGDVNIWNSQQWLQQAYLFQPTPDERGMQVWGWSSPGTHLEMLEPTVSWIIHTTSSVLASLHRSLVSGCNNLAKITAHGKKECPSLADPPSLHETSYSVKRAKRPLYKQ